MESPGEAVGPGGKAGMSKSEFVYGLFSFVFDDQLIRERFVVNLILERVIICSLN